MVQLLTQASWLLGIHVNCLASGAGGPLALLESGAASTVGAARATRLQTASAVICGRRGKQSQKMYAVVCRITMVMFTLAGGLLQCDSTVAALRVQHTPRWCMHVWKCSFGAHTQNGQIATVTIHDRDALCDSHLTLPKRACHSLPLTATHGHPTLPNSELVAMPPTTAHNPRRADVSSFTDVTTGVAPSHTHNAWPLMPDGRGIPLQCCSQRRHRGWLRTR